MKTLKHLVCVDETGLQEWAKEELQQYAEKITFFDDYPESPQEAQERIKDADTVLVSWNTQLPAEVIEATPSLKYIGMCCSLYDEASACVHIPTAKANGITVKGIKDYGDEGVVEFIMSELIRLLKGLGDQQWKTEPVELKGKKLGIIGMGATGAMLAKTALTFGMDVYYYNRSRKKDIEAAGIKYLPLEEFLDTVEMISTHLPKHTVVLNAGHIERMKASILINTSLGPTFDVEAFDRWIKKEGNFAIFDADGLGEDAGQYQENPQVLMTRKTSGWTSEAKRRLSEKVLENLRTFLN